MEVAWAWVPGHFRRVGTASDPMVSLEKPMSPIHKKILTDENKRPVAVQIDYAEWLEIEKKLEPHTVAKPPTDLSAHVGKLDWPVDGLEYQRQVRSEWPISMRIILLCLLPLCTLSACAKEDRSKFTEEARKVADNKREQIKAELVSLGDKHDWAGEYYAGDGLGVNVFFILSPQSGYVFEWRGCLGVYDRNYGGITEGDGKLRLSFTFANKQEGFQGIAEEFIPIAWGPRKYLVPADDIVGFCNQVNAGSEPREELRGWYLLRKGDETKQVTGWPRLSKPYGAYLLDCPVKATIVAVGKSTIRPSVCEWKFRDTSVTLDAGRVNHLLIGMKLYVVEPENLVESVRITKVEDHTAEAVMTQICEHNTGPNIGWKLSTRPPWAEKVKSGTTQPEDESYSHENPSRVP